MRVMQDVDLSFSSRGLFVAGVSHILCHGLECGRAVLHERTTLRGHIPNLGLQSNAERK